MKKHHKNLSLLAGILGIGLMAASCNKPDALSSKNEGSIYMPQAYGNVGTQKLYLIDSPQNVIFGAAYGGITFPSQDIKVDFKLDTNLVAAYNAQYNTSYIPFPTDHYSIAGFSSVIKAGTTTSVPLPIVVITKGLPFGVKWMLPIVFTNTSSGKMDSSLRLTYFKIDSLYTRERDITKNGTLSVAYENGGALGAGEKEGSAKLVDGDLTTKYLAGWQSSGFWFQLKYTIPTVVNTYTFTSGNDAETRDPLDWNLCASNDGATWDTLDVRTNYHFPGRIETDHFVTNNNSNKPYIYYRVNVLKNNGDSNFQMVEWRLLQYY